MAKVAPYGDPNAHGSLNKTLTFRRYKNKVIMQSLIRPGKSNSSAQIAQRDKMKAGNEAYSLLTNASKWFYHKRATQKETTRKGMFMHAYMRNFLPSTLRPIHCKSIEDMVIFNTAGHYPDNLDITIYNQLPNYLPQPEDSCILWNQLQDASLVSQIGIDGTNHGATFKPGYFDNAARIDANPEDIKFYNMTINLNEHIMEFYIKTDYDVVDGLPSDNQNHWLIDTPIAGTVPTNGRFNLTIHKTYGISMFSTVGGWLAAKDFTTSWSAGTWHRIFCIISRSASFDGDKTEAIYIDNVETASSDETLGDQQDRAYDVCIGNIARVINKIYPFDGLLDNFKIYQNPTPTLLAAIRQNGKEGWQTVGDLTQNYGTVLDNSNEFTKLQEVGTYALQVISLSTSGGNRISLPFRYLVAVEWKDQNDVITNSTVRLPQLTIEALQTVELYLSRDWSVYWDINFRRLACASRL